MADEETKTVDQSSALTVVATDQLKLEAKQILNQLIPEADAEKQKDLSYLFWQNQNKKAMVRMEKMSDLLDIITDQAMVRFTQCSDEITTKEIVDAMKAVSDLMAKGQNALTAQPEAPIIQINQQNNEVKVGEGAETGSLSRASREKVKNSVIDLLGDLGISMPNPSKKAQAEDIIDIEEEGEKDNG